MGKWYTYLIDTILTIVITVVVGWALFYRPVTGSLSDQLAVWSAKFNALAKAQADGLSKIAGGLGDSQGTVDSILASIRSRDEASLDYQRRAAASGASARAANAELQRLISAANSGSGEAEKAVDRISEYGRRAAVELGISGP